MAKILQKTNKTKLHRAEEKSLTFDIASEIVAATEKLSKVFVFLRLFPLYQNRHQIKISSPKIIQKI